MLCSVYKVRENGLEDSVMTVEEIRSGTESLGTGRRKPPSNSVYDIWFVSHNVNANVLFQNLKGLIGRF